MDFLSKGVAKILEKFRLKPYLQKQWKGEIEVGEFPHG
jgi:hypothetical protein